MKHLILSLLLIASTLTAAAKGRITAHRGEVPGSYNFWLYEPPAEGAANSSGTTFISSDTPMLEPVDYSDTEAFIRLDTEEYVPDDFLPQGTGEFVHVDTENGKPVIIFLHGASLCGNDLNRVRRYGTIHAIEGGRDMDAYVIAPQNPGGAWSPKKIMDLVDWLSQRGDVDPNRIYVLGMSLGGYGTIDLAATYPDRIAAAIAMCGGASVRNLEGLTEVPLWIIHGTADRAVSVSQSDKVVSTIKSYDPLASRLIYNRVPGMNHGQPARVFYKPETYEWLFSHRLSDDGRPIAPGFDVSVSALSNAYSGLSLKKTGTSKKRGKSTTRRKKSTRRRR